MVGMVVVVVERVMVAKEVVKAMVKEAAAVRVAAAMAAVGAMEREVAARAMVARGHRIFLLTTERTHVSMRQSGGKYDAPSGLMPTRTTRAPRMFGRAHGPERTRPKFCFATSRVNGCGGRRR